MAYKLCDHRIGHSYFVENVSPLTQATFQQTASAFFEMIRIMFDAVFLNDAQVLPTDL